MRAIVRLSVFVVVLISGCVVDTSIGDDLQLTCSGDAACPSGRSCVEGRCLTKAQVAEAAVTFVDAPSFAAGEDVRSDHDGKNEFHIAFTLNQDAAVTATSDVGAVACTRSAAAAYACSGSVFSDTTEGAHTVEIAAVDAVGRKATRQLVLVVDKTAPSAALVSTAIVRGDAIERAAGEGAVVTLSFALDEPAASVTVVGAPPDSESGTVIVDGQLVTAVLDVSAATVAEGARAVRVTTTDAVDNESTVDLPAVFTADFTAPSAPTVDDAGAVLYTRAPWGSAGGAPSFRIDGAAAAVEPGASVVVTGDDAGLAVLDVIAAGDDGAFAAALAIGDVPTIFVHTVDGAGNASATARVRDGIWIANPARPAGSTANPTSVERTPHLARARVDDAMVAVDASSLGAAALSARTDADWRQRTFSGNPPPRSRAGIAYDAGHDVVVLFGGADAAGPRDDTWTFDGERWRERSPAHTPGARSDGAMAFDAGGDVVVLFGGTDAQGAPLGDTWTFDGDDWTPSAGTAPSARSGARAASDVADAGAFGVVLFGGVDSGGTFLDDTWRFDGRTRAWAPLAPTGAPSARAHAAMTAFDSRIVLVGGDDVNGPRGDTFVFSGNNGDGAWDELVAAGGDDPPVAQADGALATLVDGNANPLALLFVGTSAGGTVPDIHLLVPDGANRWTSYDGAPPSARGACAAVGTPRGAVIASGVGPGAALVDDTLLLSAPGAAFSSLSTIEPPDLQRPSLGFAASDARTLAVGSFNGRTTWSFDGVSWQQLIADDFGAPGVLADDGTGAVAQVGTNGELEVFSFAGNAWQPVTTTPPINFGSSLAAAGDGVDVVGVGNDVAFEDAGAWTEATDPGARSDATIAFDGAGAVLFGGAGGACAPTCGDSWRFDPQTQAWTQLTPATPPPERSGAASAYDAGRDEAVMFGGLTANGAVADVWAERGGEWRQVHPLHTPPARFQHAMAPAHDGVLAFGGLVGVTAVHDLWQWRGGGDDTAALIVRAPFSGAGVDGAVVSSIDVSAVAGGRSGTVEIFAWRRGAWTSAGTAAGGTGAPAPVGTALAGDALTGATLDLDLAVADAARAGPFVDADDVVVSDVEASFRYRLP